MAKVTAKEVFDKIFKDMDFDQHLYTKILKHNLGFITRKEEHKELFGSRLIGNSYIKYTMYDKDLFYNDVFDMSYDDIVKDLEHITSINKNFKIARDDINLVCYYIAHRFLSNKELSKDKRDLYAKEILNYFNYRTLIVVSSSFFIYPISYEKAISLSERLSYKYIIKKVKNWNEYCQYRSDEYLNSKFYNLLVTFNNDDDLPNAITDLFNRTKDTLKNIYKEFIKMNEEEDYIATRKGIIKDIEGQEVIVDKVETTERYFTKLEASLTDKNLFIKKDYIGVVADIVKTISHKQLEDTLILLHDASYRDRKNNIKITTVLKDILVDTIEYLRKNDVYLGSKSNVKEIVNHIVGNILYARGTDITVNKTKETISSIIKEVYKTNKRSITDRNVTNIRNGVYLYVVLLAII